MAQSIILKRSALPGKVPTTGSLNIGEIAVNTYDGKLFIKRSGNVDSIEGIVVTNSITTGSITLTRTGSFGELVVTQDANISRDLYVTNDIIGAGDIDITGDITGSSALLSGSLILSGSQTITNNLTVLGTVNARQFNISVISSSVLFQSGSTKFGDTSDDTHSFTGSVSVSGSFLLNGQAVGGGTTSGSFTGSFTGDGSGLRGVVSDDLPIDGWDYNSNSSASISEFNNESRKYLIDFQWEEEVGTPIGFKTFISNVTGSSQIVPTEAGIKFIVGNQQVALVGPNGIESVPPAGTISGSSQLTSSFDSRYVLESETGSLQTSITNLNTFTASVTTASIVTSITNLNTFTASVSTASLVTSISNLNTTTASLNISVTNLNTFSSSENSKAVTLATYTGSVESRFSTLATLTGSNSIRLTNLETTSGSVNTRLTEIGVVTGSLISSASAAKTTNDSQGVSITNLNSATASLLIETANLESFSSSALTRLTALEVETSNLETFSGSQLSKDTTLATLTASYDGRFTTLGSLSGSFARTNSTNIFSGDQTITGSLFVTSNLIVQGSSSIQNISSSTLNIGTNIITVAVNQPSVRFGGISVIDSGSSGGSGSFLYDSVHDEFIFVHRGNGTNVTSSHFVLGPETYDNLGNETYLTNNRIPKGTGKEHLNDSQISDDGTTVSIGGALTVTGNITGPIRATNGVVSGSSQITYASISSIPSGIVSGSSQVIGILSSLNTYTGSNDTTNTAQNSRLTSIESATGSYETKGRGIVSGSSQITFSGISSLPTLVSGSSQITFSGISSLPTLVSGSSQITLASTTGFGTYINQAVLTSSSPTFAGVIINGKVTSTSGGVDGTFADAFVAQFSSNNSETNAIQTSVSSVAASSGFRFQVSNGGGSSARTTVADFVRSTQTFYGNVLPAANGTQDLGSTSARWSTVYTSDLSLNNGIGDWTIVEGEDDLFLYNNKKGKVYKFALTEVDPNIATPKKS
jgi:hypothetical protein